MKVLLVVLLLVSLLPVLLVQGGIYYRWTNVRYAEEVRGGLDRARAGAASFQSYIDGIGNETFAIGAALQALRPCSNDCASALLTAAAGEYQSAQLFHWVDPNGTIVASSVPRAIGLRISKRDAFRQCLESNQPVLSDVVSELVTGRPVFTVCRASRTPDGGVAGVVVAAIDVDQIGTIFKIDREAQGDLALFDRRGRMAYHCPKPAAELDQRKSAGEESLLRQAAKGREAHGWFSRVGSSDEYLGARVPVGDLGWVAASNRPRSQVTAPIRRWLSAAIGLNLAAVALSVGIALMIHRQIRRGIDRLRRHALAVGRGDLDHRVDVGGITELRELSEGLNQMAASRKRVETALRLSEESYRHLVQSAASIILRLDEAGRITFLNEYAQKYFGYAEREILGKPAVGTIVPQSDTAVRDLKALIRQVMDDPAKYNYSENENMTKDGRRVWVAWTNKPIAGADGRVKELLSVGLDMTSAKLAEQALQRAAKDLARSNSNLEQFAYVASHDLQEPLRAITSYLQLLQERYGGRLDEKADEYIGVAVDGARRMSSLIKALLAYSRAGRGDLIEPVDCQAVLSQSLANLAASIRERRAKVTSDALPEVLADPDAMVQLLQNLVSNAIKFCPPDRTPHIHVGAVRRADEWLFSVSDNGIGMESKDLERIFQMFQRLDPWGSVPGTGIGLAICKKIIESHGGRIWAESQTAKGSVFHFTIPLHRAVPVDAEQGVSHEEYDAHQGVAGGGQPGRRDAPAGVSHWRSVHGDARRTAGAGDKPGEV